MSRFVAAGVHLKSALLFRFLLQFCRGSVFLLRTCARPIFQIPVCKMGQRRNARIGRLIWVPTGNLRPQCFASILWYSAKFILNLTNGCEKKHFKLLKKLKKKISFYWLITHVILTFSDLWPIRLLIFLWLLV